GVTTVVVHTISVTVPAHSVYGNHREDVTLHYLSFSPMRTGVRYRSLITGLHTDAGRRVTEPSNEIAEQGRLLLVDFDSDRLHHLELVLLGEVMAQPVFGTDFDVIVEGGVFTLEGAGLLSATQIHNEGGRDAHAQLTLANSEMDIEHRSDPVYVGRTISFHMLFNPAVVWEPLTAWWFNQQGAQDEILLTLHSYDAPFVFAEVNADTIYLQEYVMNEDGVIYMGT
uniref:Protein-glutamine gamma-glutamyltransferase, tissue-type (Fragments) n=1 Tax=Pagrus major TaxID=143350 RepID=Q7LZH6_PAGMA